VAETPEHPPETQTSLRVQAVQAAVARAVAASEAPLRAGKRRCKRKTSDRRKRSR